MNDHVRSAIYAFASMIGVVVAMFLLAIFMASLSADVGFGLTWRTSMLFFPFHYTSPEIESTLAWSLTSLHWVIVAIAVGATVQPATRRRVALVALFAMVATGLGIEMLLDFSGYRPHYAAVEF